MLPNEPETVVSKNHRFESQAKMPSSEVLRMLSEADVRLLKRVLSEPVEYIADELFDLPDAEQRLVSAADEVTRGADGKPLGSDDSGVHQLGEDATKPPAQDHERRLFLRLNYCRRRVYEVLQRCNGRRLNAATVDELLSWERRVQETRSQIVRENIALVLAMGKRTRITGVDPSDLVSEGNLALLRAVNKFDCGRGYRFSTYACRAILKSFSRVAARAARHRGRFPTEYDPTLERGDHVGQRRKDVEGDCVDELRAILDEKVGNLSDVERTVIQARFALDDDSRDPDGRGKTLEQVGQLIGVTKERVRQIQNKALGKLRMMLDQAVLA